jgi:ribonuclease HI
MTITRTTQQQPQKQLQTQKQVQKQAPERKTPERPILRLPVHPATNRSLSDGQTIAGRFSLYRWDYIIAGDGSATTWDRTAGFGSVLYSKSDPEARWKFFGGLSSGTNNVAEIMAVLHPLLYLDAAADTEHRKPYVYILSDSEYVVKTGSGISRRKSNRALWSAIDDISKRFLLYFRHVPRMILPANVYGDTIGNLVRKSMEQQPD